MKLCHRYGTGGTHVVDANDRQFYHADAGRLAIHAAIGAYDDTRLACAANNGNDGNNDGSVVVMLSKI